jgi:hypothetical protein
MVMDESTAGMLHTSIRGAFAAGGRAKEILAMIDWVDAVEADAATAASIYFAEQGRAVQSSSALDEIVLNALALDGNYDTVIYPLETDPAALAPNVDVDALIVRGIQLDPHGRTGMCLALVPINQMLHAISIPSGVISASPVGGFDPECGWSRVTGEADPGSVVADHVASLRAVSAARLAIASELVGVGERALALATAHVATRKQFGRPLATFATTRYRLAECWTWLTAAAAIVDSAWDAGTVEAALTAKAYAGQAVADVVGHCTQVVGAIAVTREHQLQACARRALMLDAFLGSCMSLRGQLGSSFLAGGVIPRLVSPEAL